MTIFYICAKIHYISVHICYLKTFTERIFILHNNELSITSKTVVIIPSYEPPRSFVNYVEDLLSYGISEVLVVNDGSNEKYRYIYDDLRATDRCRVLEYETNMGKGYALKYAFSYCKENYSEDFVFATADCDGQHLSHDVINVLKSADEHRDMLVLGARDFSNPNVPKRSRTGNVQTRRIFKALYRISLSDTQTGLRAFSYNLLDRLSKIGGNRFEYEMNMLIVLHKSHVKIIEVPIETVYNEKSEDVEKVSHFRTISDSLRVISTLFKNLGWYIFSSVISAVIDVVAFYILLRFTFKSMPLWFTALFPTVAARVLSSIFNLTFNFKYVFNGQSRTAIIKYYCLWTFQLSLSYGLTFMWSYIIKDAPLAITAIKGATDLAIGILSFNIQKNWVFVKSEHNRLHHYGLLFRISRSIFNAFNRKYKSFVTPHHENPRVYVCRHLDLHGPIKVAQSLDFDCHMFVLNYFVKFKSCYRQYSTYTFTKRRGKCGAVAMFFGKIKAFFAALFVVPLVNSMNPIPVYRGKSDSLVTFRSAMKYLSKKENLVVYPDIDYTADASTSGDIYTGFLFLDKLYFKKFGEHLEFVPLSVDDEKKTITELGIVKFDSESSFEEQHATVAQNIKNLLMSSAI